MIPHLAVPFTFGPGGAALTVEQGTIDEVAQCVGVLCATPLGAREDLPTYGIPDQTFAQTYDESQIVNAVATWEPRAAVSVAAVPNGRAWDVTVNVAVGTSAPVPNPAAPPLAIGSPGVTSVSVWDDGTWDETTWS